MLLMYLPCWRQPWGRVQRLRCPCSCRCTPRPQEGADHCPLLSADQIIRKEKGKKKIKSPCLSKLSQSLQSQVELNIFLWWQLWEPGIIWEISQFDGKHPIYPTWCPLRSPGQNSTRLPQTTSPAGCCSIVRRFLLLGNKNAILVFYFRTNQDLLERRPLFWTEGKVCQHRPEPREF